MNKASKSLKKTVNKVLKLSLKLKTEKKKSSNPNVNSGILKPHPVTDAFADFAGWERGELRSRPAISKFIAQYVKANGLEHQPDKRIINLNDDLRNILQIAPEVKSIQYFDIQTYLKNVFNKKE